MHTWGAIVAAARGRPAARRRDFGTKYDDRCAQRIVVFGVLRRESRIQALQLAA
jgi:hypothetical protein